MENLQSTRRVSNVERFKTTTDFIVLAQGHTSQYFIHQLHRRLPKATIKVFLNKAQFTRPSDIEELAGLNTDKLLQQEEWGKTIAHPNISILVSNPITAIEADNHCIIDQNNTEHTYKKLIIANDALPKKLNINYLDNANVVSITDIEDIHTLLDKACGKQKIAIIGGGLFGIEAARVFVEQQHQVICIEHNSRILFEHIDDHASAYLVDHLEKHHIHTLVQEQITHISLHQTTSSIQLANGKTIECDSIVLATGTRPDTKLAIHSGIHIDRGIIVNDQLETNQPDIYAIGENVEHRGKINRLLINGTEQASVLANRLAGTDSIYVGSLLFSRLSILGYPVLTMGENGDYSSQHQQIIFRDTRSKVYRKIILHKNRITGVIALGAWTNSAFIKDAIRYKKRIWPWQLQQFKIYGEFSNTPIVLEKRDQPALNRVTENYLQEHQVISSHQIEKRPFVLLNNWSILSFSIVTAIAVYLLLPPIP